MVLKEVVYFSKGKKKKIKVEICDTIPKKFRGLMFRKESRPLLFIFNKEKNLSIHSFFCSPFKAVWLDKKMKETKSLDVDKWHFNLSGRGKYLLEIPATTLK